MSEVIKLFDEFHRKFRASKLWRDMVNTREDSPWHREANVGVHTQMLLDWYKENLADKRNEKQQLLTLLGCLFHDVGKPPAEVSKESEERGVYRAYHGHEQLSSRLWVDYALSARWTTLAPLKLELYDISNIAFMVEHHVPFAIKKKDKRSDLKRGFYERFGEAGHRAWLDLLLSDQHGRISDGQAEKLAAVDVWMKEWEAVTF